MGGENRDTWGGSEWTDSNCCEKQQIRTVRWKRANGA